MNTKFDKIYVISLITNHSRQKFIKEQFADLGLDFEFIYGTDFYNFKHDSMSNEINWPVIINGDKELINKTFGCAITHYNAVLNAYELGYNNVLIIEDDICFIKDKKLIEYYLNNIPIDADFISFDPRFSDEIEMNNIINSIKISNEYWLNISNDITCMIGAMCFGLMNRKTMNIYLNNQRLNFHTGDSVVGIWENSIINRYISLKCICIDQYNTIILNNKKTYMQYHNIYKDIYNINNDMFYTPNDLSEIFTRFDKNKFELFNA